MTTTQIPLQIGPYRPVRKLGQGGMGVVFCAEDTREPGRLVALKVISDARIGSSDDTARRFRREARILEGLRHPNIVSFYEIGITPTGQSWFAMELLTGTTLVSWIGRPWSELLPLFVQVCEGMEYLALRGIVHRDLSPENVFVVEEGGRPLTKILDFGVAKDTAGSSEETLHNVTKTGLLMGKPLYWSPEQVGNLGPGEKMDWRSDVYALGVIFHRVLSGAAPFEADTPYGFISVHLMERPAALKAPEGRPALPPGLVALVERMLEKDRKARPQSYQEMIHVLRRELGEDGTEVPVGGFAPIVSADITGVTSPAISDVRTAATDVWTGSREGAPFSEEETSRLRDMERTAAFREELPTRVTAVEAEPRTVTAVPEPVTPRRPMRLVAAAAALVAVAAAVVLVLKPWAKVVPVKTTTTVAPATGTLTLNSVPWARVVSVVDRATGKNVPIGGDLTTPARLELPPAAYTVELASGNGPEKKRLDVQVKVGEVDSESVLLAQPEETLRLLE